MSPEDVICKVFGLARHQVSETTKNEDVEAWDSMGHINLILELESTFGVTVSAEETMQMTNVADIKRVLEHRGANWR